MATLKILAVESAKTPNNVFSQILNAAPGTWIKIGKKNDDPFVVFRGISAYQSHGQGRPQEAITFLKGQTFFAHASVAGNKNHRYEVSHSVAADASSGYAKPLLVCCNSAIVEPSRSCGQTLEAEISYNKCIALCIPTPAILRRTFDLFDISTLWQFNEWFSHYEGFVNLLQQEGASFIPGSQGQQFAEKAKILRQDISKSMYSIDVIKEYIKFFKTCPQEILFL